MFEELHPESGVRVRLDLKSESAAAAEYALTLFFSAERRHHGQATVPPEGTIEIEGLIDAPAYAQAAAKAFLRQTQGSFRSAGRWPRRVLRWRAER
ncbi:MAG: hypothetical protein ACI9KE_000052 [Polyangiales bacterium]|jgi:hypothetical protein